MSGWLTLWWVWIVFGGVLAILEVALPGFILLGFAVAAVITGLLMLIGVLGGSLSVMLLVFALASLGAWLGLRRVFGRHEGQVKVWQKDINDN
jgi:membrane protein implicated in regulation of membrane protease activity